VGCQARAVQPPRPSQGICCLGGEQLAQGLCLFDEERGQIDAGWLFVLTQSGNPEADKLLLDYFQAAIAIGHSRYDEQLEYIPRLEAALNAAQRLNERPIQSYILQLLGFAYIKLSADKLLLDYFQAAIAIAHLDQIRQRLATSQSSSPADVLDKA
jgi:hypothetical protein